MPELVDPSLRLRADISAALPDEDEDADAAAAVAEYGKPKTERPKDRVELEGGEVLTCFSYLLFFIFSILIDNFFGHYIREIAVALMNCKHSQVFQ